MSDVTRLLDAVEKGEPQAAEELLPLVYEELRRLARQKMAKEQPGQTLQPTALVHEVWLRLLGRTDPHYQDSQHFFLVAAEAMRRVLVNNARRKRRLKRGGGQRPVDLDRIDIPVAPDDDDLLLVDEALNRFTDHHPEKAEVVRLRYFTGMSHPEVAKVLDLSEKTVKRYWAYAKAWLCDDIERRREQ